MSDMSEDEENELVGRLIQALGPLDTDARLDILEAVLRGVGETGLADMLAACSCLVAETRGEEDE